MFSLIVFFLVVASPPAVLATASRGDEQGLTHIHLYVHETYTGRNATAASVVSSPLGVNSSFGSVSVADDELRTDRDRSSQLLGRFQAIIVGTSREVGAAYLTSITFVFTAGEYGGSTLSVEGAVLGFKGTIERAVVGGTGKFRFAGGYTLTKLLGNPTPETVLFEVDLFVLMQHRKY
jgi:hypothetical protein